MFVTPRWTLPAAWLRQLNLTVGLLQSLRHSGRASMMTARLEGRANLLRVVGAALLLRVGLIFLFKGGGFDLRIYHYFGGLMLQGGNPYLAPADGLIDPRYADMSPLNLSVFAGVMSIWNSRQALRCLLAAVDAIILYGIGRQTWIPTRATNRILIFYAFNPLLLLAWVVAAEDKNIVFALLLALLGAVLQKRTIRASAICGILAAYKFIGFVFILPVLAFVRRRSTKPLLPAIVLVGILVVAHAAYFPESLLIYQHRLSRSESPVPIHASPLAVLAWIGIYSPRVVPVILGAVLGFLYWAHLRNKLTTGETIVLSGFAIGVISPDAGIDRLLLVALPMLVWVGPQPSRTRFIWVLSSVCSIALFWELGPPRWLPGVRAVAPVADVVFGQYGSPQHVIYMNLLPWSLLVLFLHDRRQSGLDRRVSFADRSEAGALHGGRR